MCNWFYINLQDSGSPIIELLIKFHDYLLLIDLMILVIIFYLILKVLLNRYINLFLKNQSIEIIWTVFPIIILILLALPSLKILYLIDEMYIPLISVKCLGHQWYWSYEYSDFINLNFDSYINKDLLNIRFRLLDVDNNLVLPINVQIRLLVSSVDVIHSFTVPSLGFKVDAIPGRINQVNLYINRPGLFYGQCSELCGTNHRFIPIVIESTNLDNFINWINYIILI